MSAENARHHSLNFTQAAEAAGMHLSQVIKATSVVSSAGSSLVLFFDLLLDLLLHVRIAQQMVLDVLSEAEALEAVLTGEVLQRRVAEEFLLVAWVKQVVLLRLRKLSVEKPDCPLCSGLVCIG